MFYGRTRKAFDILLELIKALKVLKSSKRHEFIVEWTFVLFCLPEVRQQAVEVFFVLAGSYLRRTALVMSYNC